ncbi:MAG: nucleotidyltransferase family protein [candidate division WOR-3 bacterium]
MNEQLSFFLNSCKTYNQILDGKLLELSKSHWIAHKIFIENYLKDFNNLVVYKGFWSGYEFYEKPYYRFISDVDILTDDENYEKLEKFFLDLGFKSYFQFSRRMPKFLRYKLEYEALFYKKFLNFEIHRKIFPSYYIEIDRRKLFKRTIEWKFNLLTFPIEEHFIISVLHFHKSSRKNLYWLWDIFILYSRIELKSVREVCKYYSIDYERFIRIFEEIKNGAFLKQNRFFKKNFKNYAKFLIFKAFQKVFKGTKDLFLP